MDLIFCTYIWLTSGSGFGFTKCIPPIFTKLGNSGLAKSTV